VIPVILLRPAIAPFTKLNSPVNRTSTMPFRTAVSIPVTEPSQVGEARRTAVAAAQNLGFSEEATARVGIVATEVGGNLLKHARGGQVVVSPLDLTDEVGLEILALDQGRGIENIARALTDGYSTAGTSGTGLGACRRLASHFELHSSAGTGTAVLAQFWERPPPRMPWAPEVEIGGLSLPHPGEECCGDRWTARLDAGRTLVLVADGLGHGRYAAEAAEGVIQVFKTHSRMRPGAILEAAHAAIRGTRGAAAAIAEIDHDAGQVRYAGIGNISGAIIVGDQRMNLVSHNGILGHQCRKVHEFVQPWPANAILVMHSDGLSTQWRLQDYAGLAARHPGLMAGVLYRDFARGRDDVTVVALREA